MRPRPARRPAGPAALVALLAGLLAVAGCTPAVQQETVTPGPSTAAAAPADGDVAAQELVWTDCADLECATARVPLDWAEPEGETIGVALTRHAATGERLGTLFINPGGPGASGVDYVPAALAEFSDTLLASYDVVGFDPRGVGLSTPVDCVDDAELDVLTATDLDTSDAGLTEAAATWGAVGAQCLERTGPLLEHVDTVSAARDLDLLRTLVGDETLTYLGFSYGTQLGATYAALFPERVGRLVLDGALDPTLTSTEVSAGQAAGFEGALRAYVAYCQGQDTCPLDGDVEDGLAQVRTLLDKATAAPLTTGQDRRLTSALAFSGIAATLYSQASWDLLTQGLTAAITRGDGSVLLALSDAYYQRDAEGRYTSNMFEAFWSIGCADSRAPADVAEMRAAAAEVEAAAPTVGPWFSYGGVTCAQWPTPVAEPLPSYAAEGAAPILVVGTTNDPATPYAWAEKLATTLSSGVLLTFEGEGHTAYRASNTCIADVVDAYLVEGTVPADGTRC
ncbi:alpha/beta hydrolase [Cellulomonas marina]|uniref:Alpha/beta hydrolase fold n=1 Tax=Cellulomonas marina TaxID=988821 RepID=A0A1I0WPL6_9CELL|nr:alpha/beta hydrolase [Cellulomonas marina]SFA90702.1 alpha/beta hydrolase fold [Cellulomonas marina]